MRSDPSRGFARSGVRALAVPDARCDAPTRRRRRDDAARGSDRVTSVGARRASRDSFSSRDSSMGSVWSVCIHSIAPSVASSDRDRARSRRTRGTPRDDDETTIRRRDDARHSDARRRRRRVASVVDARASSTRERDARAVDAMALDRALATRARASGASTSTSTRDASGRRPGPGARGRPAKGRGRGKVRGDRRDATRARRASIGTGRDVRGAVFARWGGTATSKTASDARERRECDSMES